ncbi:MAG TPA: NTP transferase domain-containing protein [Candidatus Paceibacterota bacterium]|jgi:bifunctional N-acetylglucosamine-1-phosphate-uridyltransferase/glucosamine-1-phosphate-acetyltransferase GlmU-like protein|nr:NTP transferase domain-containing protein [Candidatus Paceibacterota bacterium]
MDKIQIIILAGGKGVRMKSEGPKALTLLQGKPFLLYILDTLKKLDRKIKPIIVVGYKKEQIVDTLGAEYTYAEQREQLGTGHAVLVAREQAQKNPHQMVLILSADQPLVSKETLENIIATHTKNRLAITLGTAVVPDYKEWRAGLYSNFGRVVREQNGQVKQLVEFKNATDEEKHIKEVNPALYMFDAAWLWSNIDKIEIDPTRNEYKLTDLIHIAFSQGKTIEAVPITNLIEALQPNSKEELEVLEKLVV